jgi:glycosyltransferase involved in cell wall biosynthesis
MPCKNVCPRFFREALESVFSQTNPRWHLNVIIDDYAEEAEATGILEELGVSVDNRVSVVKNETRLLTGALNTGMKRVGDGYVCLLLSDDLLDRKAVDILGKNIDANPDIHFFYSSRQCIDGNSHPISKVYKAKESFSLSDFTDFSPVKHLLCWQVKAALAIGGMDESLGHHGADDYDFPWCMAEAGYSFKAIPECLYYYRDHREHFRLTTHVPLEIQLKELRKIWRKHGLSEEEIDEQIKKRTAGYLRQALFRDEEDKRRKERDPTFDMSKGWRERFS